MNRDTYIRQKIDCIINVTKIVTIHYFEFDKNFRSKGEKHDFWEMVYIDKGEAVVTAANTSVTLGQGEAVFHKPNEFHVINANGKTAPNVFIITFVCKSKAMDGFKNLRLYVPTPLRAYISNIVNEAEAVYHLAHNNPYLTELKIKTDAPNGGEQLIKLNLEMLLIKLLRYGENMRIPETKESMKSGPVADAVALIHNSIYSRISVGDICAKLSFSRSYLSERFKSETGASMNEYITHAKIEEAKTLIREEQHSISEISDMLCYDNPHYFSRVFKRITNMSPKEYKESVRI